MQSCCFANLHLLLVWHSHCHRCHGILNSLIRRPEVELISWQVFSVWVFYGCPVFRGKMFILTCWFRVAGLRVDVEVACPRSWGREDEKQKKNRGDKRKGNWGGKVRVSFSLLFPLFRYAWHFHFDHSSQPECLLKPSLTETEIRWKCFKNTQAKLTLKLLSRFEGDVRLLKGKICNYN